MKKGSIKNYNQFIKTTKKSGVTHRQAQLIYRQMQGEMGGKPVFASDIKKHPTIFKKAKFRIVKEGESAKYIQAVLGETHLYKYHYDNRFKFDHVEGTNIVKVSINTTKTRKKFSVRIK
jgi:hypothetical protein